MQKSLSNSTKRIIQQPCKRILRSFEHQFADFVEYEIIRPASTTIVEKLKNVAYASIENVGYYDSYFSKAITITLLDYLTDDYPDILTDVDKTLSICKDAINEIKESITLYPELVNKTIRPGIYIHRLDKKTTLVVVKKNTYDSMDVKKSSGKKQSETSFSTTIYFIGGNKNKWYDKFVESINDTTNKLMAPNQSDTRLKVHTMSSGESMTNEITTRLMKHIISPEKDKILSIIKKFIKQENVYKDLGIPHSLGILLYGPPGTGKTVMAHAIASEFKMNCVDVTLDFFDNNLGSGAFGEPHTVYVIDEIDSQLVNRALTTAEANTEATKMITSQRLIKLLKAIDEMDNGSIVVATTNYPERLDVALKRSGRFGLQFEFPEFNQELAEKMANSRNLKLEDVIDVKHQKWPLKPSDLEQEIIDKLIEINCVVMNKESFEELGLEEEDDSVVENDLKTDADVTMNELMKKIEEL